MKTKFLITIIGLSLSINTSFAFDFGSLKEKTIDKAFDNREKIAEFLIDGKEKAISKYQDYKEIRSENHSNDYFNFREAKKVMYSEIYTDTSKFETFYCGCDMERKEGRYGFYLTPILDSCGYQARKNKTRAQRIEAEHVVPAHSFGQHLSCWRNPAPNKSGRETCEDENSQFSKMEGDLHNLVPAIGEVNGDRSNYKFGMLNRSYGNYGQCDFKIDFKERSVEPRDEIKGDIARIYLYFHEKYNLKMSSQQEKMFEAWHRQDPVSSWEIERNNKIKKLQGDSNSWIE